MTDFALTMCPKCGTPLGLGDWPFCPHGRGSYGVKPDTIIGGQVIENLGPEPVRVYSETQRRALMKKRGLREFVRHHPGSEVTTNWDTPCATTLENARVLVSRPAERSAPADAPEAQLETLTLTVTERADGFRVAQDGEPYIP